MSPEHEMQLTRIAPAAMTHVDELESRETSADGNMIIVKDPMVDNSDDSSSIQGPHVEGDPLFVPEHGLFSKDRDTIRSVVDGQDEDLGYLQRVSGSRERMTNPRQQNAKHAALSDTEAHHDVQPLDSTGRSDNSRFGVARDHHSITPSTMSTNNSPTPPNHQNGFHTTTQFAAHTKELQPVEQVLKSNAMKRHVPNMIEEHGSLEMADNIDDSDAKPKRRKKDVDALRAKVEKARQAMEESKRQAEKERHKTDERRVSITLFSGDSNAVVDG